LDFSGSLNELLQLPFNVSVADVLVLQDTVCIDGERLRDLLDPEQLRNLSSETAIAMALVPCHFILRDELFPFRLIVVEADA